MSQVIHQSRVDNETLAACRVSRYYDNNSVVSFLLSPSFLPLEGRRHICNFSANVGSFRLWPWVCWPWSCGSDAWRKRKERITKVGEGHCCACLCLIIQRIVGQWTSSSFITDKSFLSHTAMHLFADYADSDWCKVKSKMHTTHQRPYDA